ncbi:MAG TPA: cytochrome P450 [Beijerinckiaceae bacterium]|jgi:cytochrome P450|nr:cytochrome P450 [Beijerinckiaceae bacterium]
MSFTLTEKRPAAFRAPAPKPREVPLGPVGLLLALRQNPVETWTRAHFEKPILVGRRVLGEMAVVSEPAAIRRVLLDNVTNYRKDDLQRRVLSPGLGDGLLTAEGKQWRAQRRTVAPMFTPRNVLSFAPQMADAARASVQRLQRRRVGQILDVSAEMARVTLEILERTIFTDGLGQGPEHFREAVTRYFDTAGRIDPLDLLGFPDFIPRIGRIRSRPTLRFFRDSVDAIIATRRKNLADPNYQRPHDLLTLLLEAKDPETGVGLDEEELRANIITFIGAGHETTANALTWSLYLLSQSPEWRERLAAEADRELAGGGAETLADRLVETRAVIEEAMRLYPPAATLTREAVEPDMLAGRRIKKGMRVVVSPFVVHRHRLLWRDPDLFMPERFLGEAREKIDRFAYLPFGAGPRVCVGASFALQEACIVLAHLMQAFRFEHVETHEVRPMQRVTLRPKDGMPMRVFARAGT